VFIAGYEPYIKRTRLVFKGLSLAGLKIKCSMLIFERSLHWQMEICRFGCASRFRI